MVFDQLPLVVGTCLRRAAARLQMIAERRNDERLDLGGRHAADRSGRLGLLLQHGLADVVAVAGTSLVGVARAHAVAALVKQSAGQEGGRAAQPATSLDRLRGKLGLHGLEQGTIEDRLVLATVNVTAVDHLADIEPVLEQMRERPHPERAPTDGAAIRALPRLAADAAPVEVVRQPTDRAKRKIALKDGADSRGFGRHHHDLLIHRRVAERDRPPDPDALAFGGRDLVAYPLPDQLPLELGKGQQHVQREPPHAGAGVERLGHRHERDRVHLEQLDQLGEIGERARQPVDLVHHHEVDPAGPNIAQQGLERRPFQRGPGEAAVIIVIWDEPPALLRLAVDVSLTGPALGIERVERKVEVMLGRLAGINGAATKLADGPVHAARSTNLRTARGNSDSPARANTSRAISALTSRAQPSAVLNATIRRGRSYWPDTRSASTV